jgi:hypothetical protein
MLLVALVLLGFGLALALAQQRRRTVTPPPTNAGGAPRTLKVNAGGDLQKSIDAARPGDTIVVEAGASFTGPFTLPDKGASEEWITIRTSAQDSALPDANTRVAPSDAPRLPKLLSPGHGEAALQTAAGAHHWRLVGLELRTAAADAQVYDLVKLGEGSAAQDTLAKVPHHLVVDRCLITAFPTQTLKRGVALHSAETTITNSYIAGFKSTEQEAQAIAGWNGPGPYHIINNYLEGAGENLMFGGAPPSIPGLVASDIEIRRNHLFKPLSWRRGEPEFAGTRWNVKDLFELKSARRVVFEGNVLENCWNEMNGGYGSINLTVRGDSGPQATIEDVLITNNVVKHVGFGINILGKDTYQPSTRGHGLKIVNNLFVDLDGKRWAEDGVFVKMSDMPDVTVDHNTVFNTGSVVVAYGPVSENFVFTNNIAPHNSYGIIGQNLGSGTDTLRAYMPGAIVAHNIIVGADLTVYPPNNYYPTKLSKVGLRGDAGGGELDAYALAPDSLYRGKATDRKDIGCDIEALKAATAGVVRR